MDVALATASRSPDPQRRPLFVVLPAGAARRVRAANNIFPWRAHILTHEADADEDTSPKGLLDTARYLFEQLFRLIPGLSKDSARPDAAPPPFLDEVALSSVRIRAANLANMVRQLLLSAALGLMAEMAANPSRQRQKAQTEARSTPRPVRARRRMLAVGVMVQRSDPATDAPPQTPPPGSPCEPPPEAASSSPSRRTAQDICGDLIERIDATLQDFDACAERLARRMLRAEQEAGQPLRIVQAEPPPSALSDGRYNPLSRHARFAWVHGMASIDQHRPNNPDDG